MDIEDAPITPREAYSGEYWRRRAKLTRDKIANIANSRARSSLEIAAREYEKLAVRADNVQREIGRLDSLPAAGFADR